MICKCYLHARRKSIASVVLIKMLLKGYLYGIKTERSLEEEVSLSDIPLVLWYGSYAKSAGSFNL